MKKTLVALAVLAATSAFAQSSVTMYGIVDLGYSNIKSNTGLSNATAEAKASGFGNSAQSSSRLGFKGTEDLGGGSTAGFTFETGLSPAGNGGEALSGFNNRQAFLTLANTSAGTFNIGRQYTPVHVATAAYSLGGANNVVGDMAYNGDIGDSTALKSTKIQAGTQSYTIRANNAISYVLPASVGFTGAIAYFTSTADSQSAGAVTAATTGRDASGYGLLASKEFGPLSIGGAYQQYTAKTISGTTNATTGEQQQTEYTLGAKYAIGAATIGFQHNSAKGEDKLSAATFPTTLALTAGNYKRNINQIALAYTFTPAVNGWASYGTGKVEDTSTGGGDKTDTSGMQLGLNYVFSKRTNLYAIYGTQKLDLSPTEQAKDTQYAIGIRHSF